ncbi:MAG: MBL fold metallo-hydrolase [Candidatus Aminicenantales bacterium]
MEYEAVIVGALETNCYLVYCEETRECAIVDPGADPQRIFSAISSRELKPVVILNTHGHIDHIGANRDMKDRFGVPLRIHAADSSMLGGEQSLELSLLLQAKASPHADSFFEEGEVIEIGKSSLEILHTPGHSPGSVSFVGDGFVLSGDTLFSGGVGRTDLPGGDWQELMHSLEDKILTMPEKTVVLPGHGPSTTVGREKVSNPFIR